jgi:hypothetical protein
MPRFDLYNLTVTQDKYDQHNQTKGKQKQPINNIESFEGKNVVLILSRSGAF